MVAAMDDKSPVEVRGARRRADRQREMSMLVAAEGTVRIEELTERFNVSLMTVHRDLDELVARRLLQKSRGVATALSSRIVESSDVFRAEQQVAEKRSLALEAMNYIEVGQSVFLDDSTTVLAIADLLHEREPLTVITNNLTLLTELRGVRGISLVGLGGNFSDWCSSFMGRMTTDAIGKLRADVFITSPTAVTDNTCFNHSLETVDTKQAMFAASARRILLVDHTKFGARALHALGPLREYDVVIVDSLTREDDIEGMRSQGVTVVVAKPAP